QPDLRDIQTIGYAPLVGNVRAAGYQPPPSGAFDVRTIAYPAKEGANLGLGWDFVTNKKKQASCVIFQEISDTKYQNAQVGLQQSIDEETLNESLNAEFSGGDLSP